MSKNVTQEIDFFENKISPLIRTNYFRNTDVTGQFVDDFLRIDIFFIVFFAGDFLLRSLVIFRRNTQLS
ncbi:MAG: hypothetical protein F6K39_00820 [Okeania sp. SIO3B3]|nr:hypothetical protein [Okeania sp. SIO3B3]